MDEATLGGWLIDAVRSLKKLNKPIAEFRRGPISSADILQNNYNERLRRFLEERGIPDARDKVWLAVGEICRVYLDATAYQRAAVRNMFDSEDDLIGWFSSYPNYVADFIRSPDEVEWVRLGLAGALINDARTDFRDVYVALGRLYLAAQRSSIDPLPHFESVGMPKAKGNPPSSGLYRLIGANYSQSLLIDFLNSEYFRGLQAGEW
jgi:hypothetical protein